MESRYERFTTLIMRINRKIKRLKTEAMSAYGLKSAHVTCLHYLYRFAPLTAAELCEKCDEDKAAVSRALDYLEKNGFIQKDTSLSGNYKSRISLTEKGMTAGKCISERITAVVREASASLSPEDSAVLYSSLDAIASALENMESE